MALVMALFTIRKMPTAASSTHIPSGSARRVRIAMCAASVLQRDFPPTKESRVDKAQHQVGVRDGRLDSAAPIAGRAGIRARAAWSDIEAPPSSIQAIEPPPAPIEWISIIGIATR